MLTPCLCAAIVSTLILMRLWTKLVRFLRGAGVTLKKPVFIQISPWRPSALNLYPYKGSFIGTVGSASTGLPHMSF